MKHATRWCRSISISGGGCAAQDASARAQRTFDLASDRAGLLYSIARVLAKHRINLQLVESRTFDSRTVLLRYQRTEQGQ